MKKIYLLISALLLSFFSMQAQTPQFYNSSGGTAHNSYPLWSNTNKVQWVFPPNLFNSTGSTGTPAYQGDITTVYIRLGTTISATASYSDFTISMGQNVGTISTFANTTYIAGLTQCYYQSSFSLTGAAALGWYAITLQVPQQYDPSQSLVLEIQSSTNSSGSGNQVAQAGGTGNQRIWGTYGSTTGTSAGNGLLDFGFDLVPSSPCVAPPTGGNAIAYNPTPCNGQSTGLNLLGNSYGSGQTYQWESATSPSGPWIPEGSSSNLTYLLVTPPTGVNYYRCQVTCGASTVASTIDTVTVPSLYPGGTYTINSALPTGSGNFQSFTDAASAIRCGISGPIVFNVAPGSGPYNEQIDLPATILSDATNTVTFNGNGDTITYSALASSPRYATINLDGADYITFNNLNIKALGDDGFGVHLMNDADYNTFNNCNIYASATSTNSSSAGVSMSGSNTSYSTQGNNGSHNSFDSCNVTGGYFGIVFYAATTGDTNNSITNCTVRDYYVYGSFNYYQRSAAILNNLFERPTRSAISTGYGVYLSTCVNMLAEKNTIRDLFGGDPATTNTAYPIYVSGDGAAGTENKLINNLIYNIQGSGTIGGIYMTGADYIQCYNNTVVLDYANAITGATYGIYNTGTLGGIDIKNNTVHITRGGYGAKYCLYYTGAGAKSSNYNNLYINSPLGSSNIGYDGADRATMAAWQASTAAGAPYDANSQTLDPLFTNATNYTPTNPLFDNLGTPLVNVLDDIDGNLRDLSTPDIGAYEFTAPACGGTPIAGNVTTTSPTVCLGATANLGLTGSTVAVGVTYQWESAPASAGPWTLEGASSGSYTITITPAANTYYRCGVTCGASTVYSDTVLITVPALYPAGTYTINSAVATGSGNFQSFTDAVSAISCGIAGPIVFNVVSGSGPYNEQINLPASINANSTNTVTFNGNGETITYSVSGVTTNYATIELYGADYITFDNLHIQALADQGFGVHLMNGADYNTFNNCIIEASQTATVTTSAAVSMSAIPISYSTGGVNGSNNTFDSCDIRGGYFGLVFYSVASGDSNNSITNCNVNEYYLYGSYNYYQKSATIGNSIFERPTRTTVSTAYGIYLSTSSNMLLQKNIIRNLFGGIVTSPNTAYPIYVSGDGAAGTENKLINNLIYNIQGNGTIAGMYLTGADYIQVYNNTIVLDYPATGGTTYGIYNTGTVGGIDIKNNSIYMTRGGGGTNYCLYYTGAGAKSSDYNNLYMTPVSTNNIGWDGAAKTTLTAWQGSTAAGAPYDANSRTIDPIFTSATDFTPKNAMLDNMGTPLMSVSDDILGVLRNGTTPDIGAYEFTVPGCTGTPTAGVAAANDTSACLNQSVILTLTGFSSGAGISVQWEESVSAGVWTAISGATTSTHVLSFATPASYRASVTCNSGTPVHSDTVITTQAPFYMCYCSPVTGTVLHTSPTNYVTNVNIANTMLNNSTSVAGGGGFVQGDPNVPNQTATVFINLPFTLNAVQSTSSVLCEAWVDLDHSGTFDAGEYYPLTYVGPASSATITLPVTALTGLTGLRVRSAITTTPNYYSATGACSNPTSGRETEDYVINILPQPTCPPPTALSYAQTATNATLSWTSAASQWEIEYGPNNFAQGTGTKTITSTNPFTTPTLAYDTMFSYFVRDICGPNDTSLWSIRKVFYLLPPNDDCANAIDISNGLTYIGTTGGATQTQAACNNTTLANDVWYKFVTGPSGGSVTVNVTTGYIDAVVQALSGACGTLTPMIPTASTALGTNGCIDGPSVGQEFGTYTVAANTTYYFRVYGYGANTPGAEGTFTINASGAPLAVKLDKISATNTGASNRVDWNTLSEELTDKFELQRSADGSNFQSIAPIDAKGEASRYTYMDHSPVQGYNYYRLLMKEANGRGVYSSIVKAFVKAAGFAVEAFPNPVSHHLIVRVSGVQGSGATVQVTDVTGKLIETVNMHDSEEKINMTGLANGIYLIKYSDANHTQTIRVNKE